MPSTSPSPRGASALLESRSMRLPSRPRRLLQTRLGSPLGNCLEATVAMLTGVGVDEVPDPRRAVRPGLRMEMGALSMRLRLPAMRRWLKARGLGAVSGYGPRPSKRLLAMAGRTRTPLFWIASGPAVRGWSHAVLYVTNPTTGVSRLFHDPHPSQAGLLRVDRWTAILPRA